MDKIVGKVVLVTGASSGIGYCLTKRLVEHGLKVIGCARTTQPLLELKETFAKENPKGTLDAVSCDLHQESEIKAMFSHIYEKYGRLDICVNNAGLGKSAPISSGETEMWRDMLDINILALCMCSREAIQLMKTAKVDDGHIVQISSMAAHVPPYSVDASMYGASKHAVKALSAGLRSELRNEESNIRISCISPALVKTDFAIRMRGVEKGTEMYQTKPALASDDVVDTILFVLSAPVHVQVDDILLRNVADKL